MPNLTTLMLDLGYKVNPKGVCEGFVALRHQAIFCGEKAEFNKRMIRIHSYIDYAGLNDLQIYQLFLLNHGSDKKFFRNKIEPSIDKNEIIMINSIFALFNGIALHQDPRETFHHDFLGDQFLHQQNIEEISKVTASVELEKRGFVKYIPGLCSHSTTYDVTSLEEKLNQLKIEIHDIQLFNTNNDLSREIAFTFSANCHSISICYYPHIKEWVIGDINLKNELTFTRTSDLAHYLIKSDVLFNNKDVIELQIRATTTGDYALIADLTRPEILPDLLDLKVDMTKLCAKYSIPPEDSTDLDAAVTKAIRNENVDKLNFLLQKLKFDPNSQPETIGGVDNSNGDTLLHYAILLEKFTAVRLLIEAGARLGLQNLRGEVPIHNLFKCLHQSSDPNINARIDYAEVAKTFMELILNKEKNLDLFFSLNSKRETPFGILLRNRNMFLITLVMLALNEIAPIAKDVKVLNFFRNEITDKVIEYLNKITDPDDRQTILDDIYNEQNALGIFLNTPKNKFSYLFSTRKVDERKVTGSIQRLHIEFDEPTTLNLRK